MSAIHDAQKVAIVGSPSTNDHVIMDLLEEAAHEPLVGQMVFLLHEITNGQIRSLELGLGVVTGIEQTNQFHANPNLRAAIKRYGNLGSLTGDQGDSRNANVKLQASYARREDEAGWRQSGNGLSTAPPTGALIRVVSNDVIDEIIAATTDDIHYLGYLHGSATRGGKVRAPMAIPDFSGPEGATHMAVFGQSGSGKSAQTEILLAGQMRFPDFGMIIVDPQGQWASETGLPFSLQGWAQELGRDVIVARISEDLKLEKDSTLFASLLGKTKFVGSLGKMGPEIHELLLDEIAKIVSKTDDWESMESSALLTEILQRLIEQVEVVDDDGNIQRRWVVLRRVYASPERQERLAENVQEVLGSADAQARVLRYFGVIHNLFQDTNPAGGPRRSLWGTISSVLDRPHGQPAPLLILDMSTSEVSWLTGLLADEEQAEVLEALSLLDSDGIKAAILRQVCGTLKRASESAFRKGGTLNTQVIFDEAWRFAPPPHLAADEPEVQALSKDLANFARDTRKFGIGWLYVTQTIRSLNPDIWSQLGIRVVGYGLSGGDLDKIAEELDERDYLRLYKGFAPPKATNPRIYPFLMMGPVSPLSFTRAPIAIAAYTNFDDFRQDNHHWISRLRGALGRPVLSGAPVAPHATAGPTITKAPSTGPRKVSKQVLTEQKDRVRANRATGGVDPAAGALLSNDDDFGDPLGSWQDDDPAPKNRSGITYDPAAGDDLPF